MMWLVVEAKEDDLLNRFPPVARDATSKGKASETSQ